MAVQSTMPGLGRQAPGFSLPDVVSGKTVTLETFAGAKALLVMFICRHCPFVVHVQDELARLGGDYQPRGVGVVAISANDADAHPEDGPDSLREQAAEVGFTFPYLHDATQEVAKVYEAACTPDLFLFDGSRRLVYRGQLDGSRPNSGVPVDGQDLRAALEAVLAGREVTPDQRPSTGCSIKWRPERA